MKRHVNPFARVSVLLCSMVAALQPPSFGQPLDGNSYYLLFDDQVPVEVEARRVGFLARPGVVEDVARRLALSDWELDSAESTGPLLYAVPEEVPVLAGANVFWGTIESARRFLNLQGDNSLLDQDMVRYWGVPVHVRLDGVQPKTPFLMNDELVVKFSESSGEAIENLRDEYLLERLQVLSEERGIYLFRATPSSPCAELSSECTTLSVANAVQQNEGTVEFAHPNFVQSAMPQQASLYGGQWQYNEEHLDLDAALALVGAVPDWPKVAVIDDGFDTDHPSLPSSSSAPFSVDTSWDGSGHFHGTPVAGLVAAEDDPNKVAPRGVCPSCQLAYVALGGYASHPCVPPRIDQVGFVGVANHLMEEGADVINASWIPDPATTTLFVSEIAHLASNGRGGLGVPIFFAATSTGGTTFSWNCSMGNIHSNTGILMAVGASGSKHQRLVSGHGDCVPLLAPTPEAQKEGISTDRRGVAGCNNTCGCSTWACPEDPQNDGYTTCFSGTSFATPLVAGTSALVLAANPDLTKQEVFNILRDTADRVDPAESVVLTRRYEPETGFGRALGLSGSVNGSGRVNAREAVKLALAEEGVDLFFRDNELDWGNSDPRFPSSHLFDQEADIQGLSGPNPNPNPYQDPWQLDHWDSQDIKVVAPCNDPVTCPAEFATVSTATDFGSFSSELVALGQTNRVVVRIRNRGPGTASSVKVRLVWANASSGLPNLPAKFWKNPSIDLSGPHWNSATCLETSEVFCEIASLDYSGSALLAPASAGIVDPAEVVTFEFVAPESSNHICFFAFAWSDEDQSLPDGSNPEHLKPDDVTPFFNNVTQRNVVDFPPLETRITTRMTIWNPDPVEAEIRLIYETPEGWSVGIGTRDQSWQDTVVPVLNLKANESAVVSLEIRRADLGADENGEVRIIQRTRAGDSATYGGVTYRFGSGRPDQLPMPFRSSDFDEDVVPERLRVRSDQR